MKYRKTDRLHFDVLLNLAKCHSS